MKIRSATVSDAFSIAAVHIQCWDETYRGILDDALIDSKSIEERAKMWEHDLANLETITLVAEEEGKIVGFAYAKKSEQCIGAQVGGLYILKDFHHRGIGRELCNGAVEWAKERGYKEICFEVLAENSAVHFYQKIGAKLVSTYDLRMGGRDYKTQLFVKNI